MPNRLTGIVDVLQGVADVLGFGDKPWGAGVVAIAVAAAFSPVLLRNQRTSRARRILTRAGASTRAAEKAALEAEALAEVRGNPLGIVVVADIAMERGRLALARAALAQLEATGKRTNDVLRLRRALEPDAPKTVDEAIVRVQRLLRMGLRVEARRRWEEAHKKWPYDEEFSKMEDDVPALPAVADPAQDGSEGSPSARPPS